MSGPVTTYVDPSKKPFSWSYSRLKNFETCAKRYWAYDVGKIVKEPESQQLKDGFFIHECLAKRIGQDIDLPEQVKQYEPWAKRVLTGEGKILVEQKLAIREDFSACKYFDKDVWFRGVGDVIKLIGPIGLIIDWKNGKIVEDSVQLMLMAQCVFSHYPEIQAVRSEFVWLAHDATTRQDFKRGEMAGHWANLLPRVKELRQAHIDESYPAKPGYLCRKWCAVTKCPHHGE